MKSALAITLSIVSLGCGSSDSPAKGSGGGGASTHPIGAGGSSGDGTGGSSIGGASTNGGGAASSEGGGGSGGSADTGKTKGGVQLPDGWTLKDSDRFGTAASQNIKTAAELHAKYYEGQSYNRNADGTVKIPNVVINHEQETYRHFEDSIAFKTDHLTIEGRGQSDGSIWSAEFVSKLSMRTFCVEAKYQIPTTDKSWPAFWMYGDADGHDTSEIDVEQPVYASNNGGSQNQHQMSLYNHPSNGDITILDQHFTTQWMTYTDASFDGSSAPHVYTICYDDAASLLTRYLDAVAIYKATWQWNASLGGPGHGPDPSVIVNLAVGGDWPGNTADPKGFSADFDVYSIEWYGP
jgi:hypothetical protein